MVPSCDIIFLYVYMSYNKSKRHACVYCNEDTSQEDYVDCVYVRGVWDCTAHKYICHRCSLLKQLWILANKINEELGFDYL